ncbi:MAG: peptide ABC transporter substrate-binding protein [Chloroflexi bacterium]|nr:peptide ABC transporter substrate-binding protein [Chloroflexota bacterium]
MVRFPALTLAAALALTAPLLAAGCGAVEFGVEFGGDEERVLTLRYWQAPSLPSPYLSSGFKDRDASAVTLEPLASYDPEGRLVPRLAAAIPTVENGGIAPDGTRITWRLRPDLRWSDGSELTADDVVFTWRYCTAAESGCTNDSAFAGIASVSAPDERTVEILFEAPRSYPYDAFVGAATPVISEAQFARCLGEAARRCVEQNESPLGSGPYRIVEFVPNERALYERNPHYRGERPYFDRVVLEGGGDAHSAAHAVLVSGEADYAWNLQLEPGELAELEAGGQGTVVAAFASIVERLVLNQTNPDPSLGERRSEYLDGENPHPFLTFAPIRRAMSMAISRDRIATELYGFAGRPTCNLIAAPPRYASTGNEECLRQDRAGANALLDASGVADTDGDGIREYQGLPLRITYQTTVNPVRQATQELVRGWWREIGIEAELVQHDASVFFGADAVSDPAASYRRFFADVQMYATGPGVDPQGYLEGLRCDHIQTREDNWAGENNARSCNPSYDELLARLAALPLGTGREALVRELNDVLVESRYEIPLVLRGSVSAHARTLEGVRINGWDSELWNIAEWRR